MRQKERHSLIVCLASVLEMDRPVQAVAENRRDGKRWDFHCFRSVEQWKITPGPGKGPVYGHNTGFKWSFYDTRSCTRIEVSRHAGVYQVWDWGAIHPLEITFAQQTAVVREPATGTSQRYRVEV